jgi:hypothetical protein
MSNMCAPDLPFWQTVVWQLKQIGAALVVVVVGIAVPVLAVYSAATRKNKA